MQKEREKGAAARWVGGLEMRGKKQSEREGSGEGEDGEADHGEAPDLFREEKEGKKERQIAQLQSVPAGHM